MKKIYTDGACSGNPGPGGWGIVVLNDDKIIRKLGGYEAQTTNNRMELIATIEALRYIDRGESVKIYTDSTYVRKGITEWIKRWERNGWKTARKKPVKNKNLWQELNDLNNSKVQWFYVPGHSGNPMNELADSIATGFIKTKESRAEIPLDN